MKKFCSLLLTFLMIFGMLQITTFAEDSVEVIEYPEAMGKIRLLYELGIFDVEYDVADSVARCDFAAILTKLLKAENMLDSAKGTAYTDVAVGDYASAQINLMNIMGIMTGKSATEFYPNDNITADEALSALVRLLGYNAKAYAKGGWTTGFNMTAKDLGINKGVPSELCVDYAGAGALAIMIFNTMEVPMVGNYSSKDGSYVVLSGNDITIMEDYWNIVKDEGIVNGVGNTNISGLNDPLEIDEIEINMVDFKITDFTYKEYLGMNVEYYYIEKENALKQTISFMEPIGNAKKVRLLSKNPTSIDGNTVTYTERDTKKKTTYKVSGDAVILYNGYFATDLEEKWPENGYVDLISSGGSSYDIVIIYDFETYVVKSVFENRITLEYDAVSSVTGASYIELDANDLTASIIKNGEYITVEDIRSGNVISVAYDSNVGYMIYVSDDVKNVYIESMLSNPFRVTDAEGTYIVNEDFLDLIDSGYSGFKALEPGFDYDFKFDFMGNIYGMAETESDMAYGFVGGVMSNGAFSDEVQVKMLSQFGQKVYTLDEKVKLDGVDTERSKVYEYLTDKLTTTNPSNLPVAKFKLKDNTIITALTMKTIEGHHPEQVSDDIIVRTRTAVPGTTTTYSCYQTYYKAFTSYLWSSQGQGSLFPENTPAMYVTVETDANGKYIFGDDTKWRTGVFTSILPQTDNIIYPITLYDCDELCRIGFMVYMEVSAGADIKVNRPLCMVESVSLAVDSNEDTVYRLNYWTNGEKSSAITASTEDVIDVVKTLKEGDVVIFNVGLNSEIIAIEKVFSYDIANYDVDTMYKNGGRIHSLMKGTTQDTYYFLTSFDKSYVGTTQSYVKFDNKKIHDVSKVFRVSNPVVTIYDGSSFTRGDLNSLVKGDVIFASTATFSINQIFVLRNFTGNMEIAIGVQVAPQVYKNVQ